jgi:hypothetical protein
MPPLSHTPPPQQSSPTGFSLPPINAHTPHGPRQTLPPLPILQRPSKTSSITSILNGDSKPSGGRPGGITLPPLNAMAGPPSGAPGAPGAPGTPGAPPGMYPPRQQSPPGPYPPYWQ